MALGSHDAGGTRPLGWGSHMELESWVNWVGMTPNAAIVAATSDAAKFLGMENELGNAGAGEGRGLHRPRRQSARRHQEHAEDFRRVSQGEEGRPSRDGRQVAGRV